MTKAILVTGATGNQGGAVLDALIKQTSDDFVIIALTRDPTSPTAKRLSTRSRSVHVLQGNMDNPDQVFSEAQRMVGTPIWGVFMVQVCSFLRLRLTLTDPSQSVIAGGVTAAQEEVQGKNFIDACIAHNVKMLVYSSVDRGGDINSAQDPTPVSVFASKHRIEQHLFKAAEKTNMSWLVLRPTGLIEPLLRDGFIGKMVRTSWRVYMKPNKPLQWVSCRDVGHFAVLGFLHPEQWEGRCLSLAGWEGTFAEANAVHKTVTGEDLSLTFGLATRFICGVVVKDLSISYDWYNAKGFGADVGRLRQLHPDLLNLEDCLREQVSRAS